MHASSPLILAVDASARSASVAVGDASGLLAEMNSNVKATHSQTLLPMLHSLLRCTGISLQEIGCFAVSAGPGSFTGLRIAIGAIKGLAYGLDRPCVAVSTLEAIARGLPEADGLLCAAMDARCKQVYTALFDSSPGSLRRRTEDMALSLEELCGLLAREEKRVFFVGDGAELCYNTVTERYPDRLAQWRLAAEPVRLQRACGVWLAARERLADGQTVSAADLAPTYLRLPQAERERLKHLSPPAVGKESL